VEISKVFRPVFAIATQHWHISRSRTASWRI